MSKNENRRSKLITALGLVGLMLGLSAPMASAFSNANYAGRYACSAASNSDSLTAVIKYNPNGSGAYSAGTLIASLEPFDTDADLLPPSMDFCFYTLDVVASSYNIATDGTGFEQLVWTAAPTNSTTPPGCPLTFTEQTAIGLRNMMDAGGVVVIRAEFATANLLNGNEGGHGTCLK